MFNRFDLKIIIDSNLVKISFLDVELELCNDTYAPYKKPNFQAIYVYVRSNHPRYVVNQVPKSINKRLTTISKNESSSNRAKQHYQEALAKRGHKHELKYNAGNDKNTKKKKYPVFHATVLFVG